MYKLPLFPLNTVLFPGMPLRLRIFEARYKEMINLCLQSHQPFGVVLIQEGVEANGPLAEPHPIGCSAQIIQVEPLAQGQMNITAVGQERFKIITLNHDHAYLDSIVESCPFDEEKPLALSRAGQRLRPWAERYLQMLTEVGDVDFDPQQLPEEPLGLAYLAAYLIQVPPAQKQALLSLDQADTFVNTVSTLCRREVLLLDGGMARANADEARPFSLN